MPVYCYQCPDCDNKFEVRHSMSFEDQACTDCSSKNVFKIPSLSEVKLPLSKKSATGKVVDDYIRDTKKEIKLEKQHLRNREL